MLIYNEMLLVLITLFSLIPQMALVAACRSTVKAKVLLFYYTCHTSFAYFSGIMDYVSGFVFLLSILKNLHEVEALPI
jgi:uncharacterized protein with PQ loop repeat